MKHDAAGQAKGWKVGQRNKQEQAMPILETPPEDYEALRAAIAAGYETLSSRLRQIASYALDHRIDMAMATIAVRAEV